MSQRERRYALILVCLALSGCGALRPESSIRDSPAPSLGPTDSTDVRVLALGATYRFHWNAHGPWAIHMLEIDAGACGVDFRTIKGGDLLAARETTSSMAARAAQANGRPVIAAINADFFSFTPPGVPEGPQVSAGEVVALEGTHREALESRMLGSQPVAGIDANGQHFIGDLRSRVLLRTRNGVTSQLAGINRASQANPEGPVLYNRFAGEHVPDDSSAVAVTLRRLERPSAAGDAVVELVVAVDSPAVGLRIPPDGSVLVGRAQAGRLLRQSAVGDTLVWHVRFEGTPERVQELVGGYPLLLHEGVSAYTRETGIRPPFSDVRHPRSAIGWRSNGGPVLLLVVDGRQPEYSVGMTLAELAEYLRGRGVTEAMNFDGGGSSTMVIQGEIINRPTDLDGERPVANALAILGPAFGSCRAP